jgi:hypothetical protein
MQKPIHEKHKSQSRLNLENSGLKIMKAELSPKKKMLTLSKLLKS